MAKEETNTNKGEKQKALEAALSKIEKDFGLPSKK